MQGAEEYRKLATDEEPTRVVCFQRTSSLHSLLYFFLIMVALHLVQHLWHGWRVQMWCNPQRKCLY